MSWINAFELLRTMVIDLVKSALIVSPLGFRNEAKIGSVSLIKDSALVGP